MPFSTPSREKHKGLAYQFQKLSRHKYYHSTKRTTYALSIQEIESIIRYGILGILKRPSSRAFQFSKDFDGFPLKSSTFVDKGASDAAA